jgi:hypothetical protein
MGCVKHDNSTNNGNRGKCRHISKANNPGTRVIGGGRSSSKKKKGQPFLGPPETRQNTVHSHSDGSSDS